jgi:hypothetical protein
MSTTIIKAASLTASLAVALAGCADLHEQFLASAGASSANSGATAPTLRMPHSRPSPQPALDN